MLWGINCRFSGSTFEFMNTTRNSRIDKIMDRFKLRKTNRCVEPVKTTSF